MKRLVLVFVFSICTIACSNETLIVDLANTTVELDAYSGLPNPRFQLTATEREELEDRLQELPATSAAAMPDNLGYRGFVIHDENGTSERITVTRTGFVVEHARSGNKWYRDAHGAELYLIQIANARGYGGAVAR